MFTKEDMFELLGCAKELFPICIPSYKRWKRKDNTTVAKIVERSDDEIREKTILFVRGDQADLYKKEYPNIKIVVLPSVGGLASTRQFIEDYMFENGFPYFIDIDDDITSLKAVVLDNGKPRTTRKDEVSIGSVIRLSCEIARIAFEEDECVLGKPHRMHYANTIENTQTAYITNKGATPRSVTFINARGIRRLGVRRNFMFDPTGDDVGFVAEIGKRKGSMFNIPCLAYSFVDDAVNSVIRNEENCRALAEYEYDCLKQYPMIDYLRIPFRYPDGGYKFSDIDFAKYRKITGLKSRSVSAESIYRKIKNRYSKEK